jgi:hypothetical protein
MATLLIVAGMLAGLVALACAAFAWNGRRIAGAVTRRGVIDGMAVGDAGLAPLSGRPSAWWRVVITHPRRAVAVSAETMSLDDGRRPVALRAAAIAPHPEHICHYACDADPLSAPGPTFVRELHHGEASDAPWVAEEYSVAPGERVTVIAVREPDGTYGLPRPGRRLYATGGAAQIAANARRGARHMAKLALALGAVATLLVSGGIVLG